MVSNINLNNFSLFDTTKTINTTNRTIATNNNTQDTITIANKKTNNKKKIILIGAVCTASIASFAAVFAAFKRGKLLNSANGDSTKFINNIKEGFKTFGKKGREQYNSILENNKLQAQTNVPKTTPNLPETNPAPDAPKAPNLKSNHLLDECEIQEKGGFYPKTPILEDETSAQKDIEKWVKRVEEAPTLIETKGASKYYLNGEYDIEELKKVKPHNYSETSDIYFTTRTYSSGFPENGFGVTDREMGELKQGCVVDYISNNFAFPTGKEMQPMEDCQLGYIAKITKDNKACIQIKFLSGRTDLGARPCPIMLVLKSKDENFTQEQLDLIKVFNSLDKEDLKNSIFGSCFLQEEIGNRKESTLFFNKNMFLSLIKHEADKRPDIDIKEYLESNNNLIYKVLDRSYDNISFIPKHAPKPFLEQS